MAIMRTNRLTSKTTPPQKKSQTTRDVTVTNVKRKMTPASELEAQDAAYNKYVKDLDVYNEKTKRYNESVRLSKDGRDYRPFFGSEKNTRRLNPTEAAEFNKIQREGVGEMYLEQKDINVPKSVKNLKDVKSWMGTDIKPTAPQKREKADWSTVQLDKMTTKTPTSIKTPKGKIRDMKVQEFSEFEAPSNVTKKTRTKAGMTGGGDKLVRTKNPSGSLGANRVTIEKTKAAPGYNREKKQFEAFSKSLPTGGYLNTMEDTSPVINRAKAEAKQLKSDYRKEGNREGVKMMRAEVKQLGKAAKFADKMYEKGGGDYFTRDMVKGYRSSTSNPANQNTIQRQEQLINKRK
jgi:hypothetical protein